VEDPSEDIEEDLDLGEHRATWACQVAVLTPARSVGMSLTQTMIHLGIARLTKMLTS